MCLVALTMVLAAAATGAAPPVAVDPAELPVIKSTCALAESRWGEARDAALTQPLRLALASFDWAGRRVRGLRFDCRFSVQVRCAADLDGRPGEELLVRLRWAEPRGVSAACTPEARVLFHELIAVVTGVPAVPAVLDLVSHETARRDGELDTQVELVRLPDGSTGLRGGAASAGRGGCDAGGPWVGVLRDGRFKRLRGGDPELCKF